MDPAVSALCNESGELRRVAGVKAGGRAAYEWLSFEFAEGVLGLTCNQDTDEVIVTIGHADPLALAVDDEWVQDLLGKWISYGWDLRNHRECLDAFQLRLVDLAKDDRPEAAVQLEVSASTIHARRVDTA